MSPQPDLPFRPHSEAAAAREEAMARVEEHADPEWKTAALAAVLTVARSRDTFTTDDVWRAIPATVDTHERRALGPIMRQAAALGAIKATDRYEDSSRVACHARPLRVWASRVRT